MLSFFALRNQSGLFLHFCCFSIVKVLRAFVSQAQRLIICVSLISSRFFFEKSLRSFFLFFRDHRNPFSKADYYYISLAPLLSIYLV